jgi:DNA-binding winged helix-turn-helix (wHTH) protein
VVYRFGDFTLDEAIRQLSRSGSELHLSPKAFELLTFLLASRHRAVSKAELLQHLWPSTFVEETNIAGLVAEIRRAVQDSASQPLFIRTVYGFGYRFVGDVVAGAATTRPASPGVKVCLIFQTREILLMEGANVIGRDPAATIHIESPAVSRHHARILVSNDEATLEDLGSKNGTHVNGSRIAAPVRLADGDSIGLGTSTLRFRIAPLTSATETVPVS